MRLVLGFKLINVPLVREDFTSIKQPAMKILKKLMGFTRIFNQNLFNLAILTVKYAIKVAMIAATNVPKDTFFKKMKKPVRAIVLGNV